MRGDKDQKKTRKFNEERKQSIWRNFNTAEAGTEGVLVTIIYPSRDNIVFVRENEEKRKELYDALLIDVFGSGEEGFVDAFPFSCEAAKYIPNYNFTDRNGFDIVKSSIFGGNPNIFRTACDLIGLDNIRDKKAALDFALKNRLDDITKSLSEELDKIVKENEEALLKEVMEKDEPTISKSKARKLKSAAKKANKEKSSNDEIDSTEEQSSNSTDDKQDSAVEINGSNSVEEKIKEAIQEEKIITTLEEVSLNMEQIKYDNFDLDSMRKESLEEFLNALSERLEEEQELKNIQDLCSELMKKDSENDKIEVENIEVEKEPIVSDLNVNADVFVPLSERNDNSSNKKPPAQVLPYNHENVLASDRGRGKGGKGV